MKKALFCGLVLLTLTATAFVAPPNPLVGRWQRQFPGMLFMLNFRADGTYDAFINGKAFVNGTYVLKQEDFTLNDGLCNLNYFGTYKLRFYSGTDSIRFTVVQDTCTARRRGSDGLTMGRVKPVKP
jgi:hypothetical protein